MKTQFYGFKTELKGRFFYYNVPTNLFTGERHQDRTSAATQPQTPRRQFWRLLLEKKTLCHQVLIENMERSPIE